MVGIARGHDIDCTVAPTHNEGTKSLVYSRTLLRFGSRGHDIDCTENQMFVFLGGMT